jgi:uncharacterized protein (UPF0264 family)
MMIDVHIADGRTTFRFKSRGQFIDLVKDEFVPCKLTSVRAGSVAFTRVVDGPERLDFNIRFPPPEAH